MATKYGAAFFFLKIKRGRKMAMGIIILCVGPLCLVNGIIKSMSGSRERVHIAIMLAFFPPPIALLIRYPRAM